jgi:hypothetical protein
MIEYRELRLYSTSCALGQVLARIPEAGPWTAFVTVHPSVAKEVEEGELRDYFHDGEKIKVEKVRIVLHRDTGNVKMAFVDFDDAASLRNALYLQVPSAGKVSPVMHRKGIPWGNLLLSAFLWGA